jgi:hypothetical protein
MPLKNLLSCLLFIASLSTWAQHSPRPTHGGQGGHGPGPVPGQGGGYNPPPRPPHNNPNPYPTNPGQVNHPRPYPTNPGQGGYNPPPRPPHGGQAGNGPYNPNPGHYNGGTPYNGYHHTPYYPPYANYNRYYTPYDYYRTVPNNYVYLNWILFMNSGYGPGYVIINNYPYYIYNNYQYRYSPYDNCNYELVDSYTNQAVQNFWGVTCNQGYDQCAYQRDNMNYYDNYNRYFCAETTNTYYNNY